MTSLSKKVQERAIREAAIAWHMRNNEDASADDVAERFEYHSLEGLRRQWKSWGLPDWILGEEPKTTRANKKGRKKSALLVRDLGPVKGLPPASSAIPLFKERLEALLESADLLEHVDEDVRGRYFVRTNVEKAPVFYPRERYSKEEWDKLCDQYELDPDDKGYWDTNAIVKLPGGVARSPSEIEATLVGVYALAGGRMDLLLDALHEDKPPLGSATCEEIRLCIEGSRADGDPKNGLKVLAQHLATWVRSSQVRRGRRGGRSEADHAFACRITYDRKHGLTDEQIAHKESHRKKEDGTSYSVKDVTELGDLELSWP